MERIGQYNVRRLIGEGGMGKVYEAEEELTGRVVALKVLRNELSRSDNGRRLFLNEMRILANLDHRNIVRSLTSFEDEGKLVMVLEHLPGETLRHVLLEEGPMGWAEAVHIAAEVADALAAAHAQEEPVIHRDLKPDNIMILEDDRVKVMDFGIAKVVQELTQTHTQSVGTLQYMSPEQIDARALSPRSDLYCLGLVLYEMLTGEPPFSSPSPRELLNLQCTADPPPLDDDLRASLPEGLEDLMLALLEKDPEDRPEDTADVHAQLLGLLGEEAPTREPKAASKKTPEETPAEGGASEEDEVAEATDAASDPGEDDAAEASAAEDAPSEDAAAAQPESTKVAADLQESEPSDGLRMLTIVGVTFALGIILLIVVDPLGGRQDPPEPEPATNAVIGGGADVVEPPADTRGGEAAPDALAVGPLKPDGTLPAKHAAPDGAELLRVQGGNFVLGSPDAVGEPDEHPQRNITLHEFLMDTTEVTVASYQQCVNEGGCGRDLFTANSTANPTCNLGAPGREGHPMNCISDAGAEAFCAWRSGKDSAIRYRLPAENEWERAARHTDGRRFPWGGAAPDCTVTAMGGCGSGGTTPAGSHPGDQSPAGLLDLGGNVSEWVLIAYAAPLDEARLARGESIGRNLRGGNWKDNRGRRGADRDTVPVPLGTSGRGADDIGFRCVGLAR